MSLKHAVIYGASGGIGSAVSKKLILNGYKLSLFSKNHSKLNELKESLSSLSKENNNINCFKVDLENISSIKSSVDHVRKSNVPITDLIICSGYNKDNLILNENDENIEKILRINLTSLISLCKYYSKLLIKQKQDSSIVLIGSIVGLLGNKGQTTYSSSKSALNGLVKSLSKEYEEKKIRVNLIVPGFIKTPMIEHLDVKKLVEKIPLGRIGKPEDIANAIFFISNNKSINRQSLIIDGGIHMII